MLTGLLSPFSSYNNAAGNTCAHTSLLSCPFRESRYACGETRGKLLLFAKLGTGVQRFLGIFSSEGGRKGGGQDPLHLQNRDDWKVVINIETCAPPLSEYHNTTKKFSCFPTGITSAFLLKCLLLIKHSFWGVAVSSEALSTDPVSLGAGCSEGGAAPGAVGPRPWGGPGSVLGVELARVHSPCPCRPLYS